MYLQTHSYMQSGITIASRAGPAGARAVPLPAAVPAPAALVPHQHAGVHGGPRHLGGRGSTHRGRLRPHSRHPDYTRCPGVRAGRYHPFVTSCLLARELHLSGYLLTAESISSPKCNIVAHKDSYLIGCVCKLADKEAILETLTVAELAALLTAMQLMPRLRGQPATKDKLLDTLREAMQAQPAHADHQKVSCTELGQPQCSGHC